MSSGRNDSGGITASTEPTSTARWMECTLSNSAATSPSFSARTDARSSSSSAVSTALRKKLDFLEWLQAETLRLYKEGACSREIAARLLKRRPALVCFSNGELSPVHLIRSILREHR